MSAIAADEFRVGEETELLLNIPPERLVLHAVVRNKNQFRYGFGLAGITEEQRAHIRRLCDSSLPYAGGGGILGKGRSAIACLARMSAARKERYGKEEN